MLEGICGHFVTPNCLKGRHADRQTDRQTDWGGCWPSPIWQWFHISLKNSNFRLSACSCLSKWQLQSNDTFIDHVAVMNLISMRPQPISYLTCHNITGTWHFIGACVVRTYTGNPIGDFKGGGDYPDSKVHGPTWGRSGADRTQVGPMLAPWTLLSG